MYKKKRWISRQKGLLLQSQDLIATKLLSLEYYQVMVINNYLDSITYFDSSHSFIEYLEVRNLKNLLCLLIKQRNRVIQEYLHRNEDGIKIEYFPAVGSPKFNAVGVLESGKT